MINVPKGLAPHEVDLYISSETIGLKVLERK